MSSSDDAKTEGVRGAMVYQMMLLLDVATSGGEEKCTIEMV